MNYDNNISCFSCIKWSCDNKIALCGDASLIIMVIYIINAFMLFIDITVLYFHECN